MLESSLALKCGSVFRGLPRLCKSSPFKILSNGFTSVAEFNRVADETLICLHDYFDELLERCPLISDNELKDGVLSVTVAQAKPITYVINKQTPNFQLWLSSPLSGPKRFDYSEIEDAWVYRRARISLHQLLQSEIEKFLVIEDVNFFECLHSGMPEFDI